MNRYTSQTAHFNMYRCAQSVRTSHMMLHAHAWLKFKLCLPQKSHSISCAMSHAMHGTRSTSSSSFPVFHVYKGWSLPEIPAQIHENTEGDGNTDPEPLTGYEPNRIVDNQITYEQEDFTCTEDNQITELEGHMSNLCPTTSHCCFPLKILLKALLRLRTTNKFVLCWLHHGTYRSEKHVRNDRKFITLKEMSSSSQGLNFIGTGELVALFSHPSRLNLDAFSEREREQPVDFLVSNESIFRIFNPVNVAKSLLDGNRDHLQDAHHGYVESRRGQARQQEESAMKEKALRDTQITSMHEMGEMKIAQELRVNEFSLQKLRESHETTQRLTSQVQELQERMNYMNDSGEFQVKK